MAKQTINIGTAPNDGTGDTARDAFDICNDNFTELYDGKLALDGSTEMTGDLVFTEKADHSSTPGAGKGYLWVKSDTPSSLIFTDDAGTDYDLTDISGGAFTADAQTQITPSTPIVLDEATGDEVALDLSYTVNKATSGNDTGLLINQTDTASPGTSLLADFQVGGTSKAHIRANGQIVATSNSNVAFDFYPTGNPSGIGGSWDRMYVTLNNNNALFLRNNASVGLVITSGLPIGWSSSSTNASLGTDTLLYRDAAGVVRVDDALRISDTGYTVATLPTGTVGTIARVTDASSPSVGSTVTGGAAAAALVWYNGSNWTVIGV